MASPYRKDSFLRNAEIMEKNFLGMNPLPKMSPNVNDSPYTIGHGYHERPDLLAFQLYGNSRLWWVFPLRNPDLIQDPIRDFVAGLTIIVPPRNVVDTYIKG